MRNHLTCTLCLVVSTGTLGLGAGCSTSASPSTDDPTRGSNDGGGSGTTPTTTVDGGGSPGTGTSTAGNGDGGTSEGGGEVVVVTKTSTCAPAKVTLSPDIVLPGATTGYLANLRTADFNNDGATDIAMILGNTGVLVYLSKGDGTFDAPTTVYDKVGMGPGFVTGDFSGDGLPDILVSSFGNLTADSSVDLLVSKGDGTFAPPVNTVTTYSNFFAMYAADFNKDGKLDFLYTGQGGSSVVLNNGQGFSGPGSMFAIATTGIYEVGDFNGDGAADIVFPDPTMGACIMLDNGSGTFGTPTCTAAIPGQTPDTALAGDVNGDGKVDVVTLQKNPQAVGESVSIYFGKGDGTLGSPAVGNFASGFAGAELVDANNDAKLDIAIYTGTSVTVLPNDGEGGFTGAASMYTLGTGTVQSQDDIVSGDFRGNGLRGFAVIDRRASGIDVISATCSP